jgi:hypothetical protein
MSAVQYGIWFVAAVWLVLTTVSAVFARGKILSLQRKFDELSERVKGLEVAEQRRFIKEINAPKAAGKPRRQNGAPIEGPVTVAPRKSVSVRAVE